VRLILASTSPRRAELLRAAGFSFDIVAPDVDETQRDGEPAEEYVRRLASDKSFAGLKSCATAADQNACATAADLNACATAAGLNASATAVVLAADTVVVVDGDILGKPRDDADAASMLRRLSGRWHEVLTGVSVRSFTEEITDCAITRVQFAELSAADVEWYVTSGETRDKAGAYAIQGLASRFIPRIEGSYSNVVGLPIALVRELLKPFETRYSGQ